MPKPPTEYEIENDRIARILRERKQWERLTEWRQSRRGNLTRFWEGRTLTIFRCDDNRFRWSIHDDEMGTEYSEESHSSAASAMISLSDVLCIGGC